MDHSGHECIGMEIHNATEANLQPKILVDQDVFLNTLKGLNNNLPLKTLFLF
jgi:hypothetical protein